jgi:hypothetical protein
MRAAALALALLAGCSTFGSDAPLEPDTSTGVEYKDIPVTTERRVDLLFVIDDSAAMAPFEPTLRENWPQFMNVLDTIQGGLPEFHIGVVTGDPADGGDMQRSPHVRGPFLVHDGSASQNYDEKLADVFSELADVGTHGAPLQQPLAMAMRALRDPRNLGFLRADAYLAVVLVSARDDHSPGPVSEVVSELMALKDDPARIIVADISGPDDAPCMYDGAIALQAPRLVTFIDAFPNRSTFTTICNNDLTDGLVLFGGFPEQPIGSPCLDKPLHMTADGDYDCSVSDVQHPGTSQQTEQILPSCETGTLPCWEIISDPQDCSANDSLALQVERAGDVPDDDHVIAECVTN